MLFPSRVRPGLADGTITDDPRLGLRAEADLDDDERAEVERRLRRLPWALPTLRLIGERPATVSTELAAEMGVERAQLKQRVRRLKALGLTVSLEVGYRLSPRGEAVLGRLERGDAMLANARVSAALPAQDFARARRFYTDVLGLPVRMEMGENAAFECGGGTMVFVFASQFAGTNQATAAGFAVDDLDEAMAELRRRGVEFEDYDLPGLKTVDGVATFGENRVAYFKDTEGNILSMGQMG